jgi:hypothetical protein
VCVALLNFQMHYEHIEMHGYFCVHAIANARVNTIFSIELSSGSHYMVFVIPSTYEFFLFTTFCCCFTVSLDSLMCLLNGKCFSDIYYLLHFFFM